MLLVGEGPECRKETKNLSRNAFSDHISCRPQGTWWPTRAASVGWTVRYFPTPVLSSRPVQGFHLVICLRSFLFVLVLWGFLPDEKVLGKEGKEMVPFIGSFRAFDLFNSIHKYVTKILNHRILIKNCVSINILRKKQFCVGTI